MTTKGTFLNRLKYGKHKFFNGTEAYAMPHNNPDGTTGGWVAESAVATEKCYISPDAEVMEYAQVLDEVTLLGAACVSGFAVVKDKAILEDESHITDNALVEGTALVTGATHLGGRSHIDWGIVDTDKMHDYLIQLENQKIEKPKNVRMG